MASSFARMRSLPHQAKATSSTAFTMSFTAVDRPTTAAMMAAEPDCCPEICPVCSTSSGTNPTPCLKCRAVFYCSVRHRDAHAFQHRAVCEKLRAKRAALDHAQTARVMSAEPTLRPTNGGIGVEKWGVGSESMDSDVATDDEGDSGFFGQQQRNNNQSKFSGAFGAAARHSMHPSNQSHNNSATYTNPHATYSRPATSAGLSAHGGRQQPQNSAPSVVGVARAGLTPHQYGATHNGRPSSSAYQARPLTVGHTPTPPRSGGGGLQAERDRGGGDEEYVRELGRASWHVLHCMAERFPVIPTRQEQDAAVSFLNGFAMLYPCAKCQRHFQELLRSHPPDTSSRQGFAQWMEFFHDQVNIILGKPTQRL